MFPKFAFEILKLQQRQVYDPKQQNRLAIPEKGECENYCQVLFSGKQK